MNNISIYFKIRKITKFTILLLSIFGLISTSSYNILPATIIFEILLLYSFSVANWTVDRKNIIPLSLIAIYILYYFYVGLVLKNSDVRDIITVIKMFFYIVIFLLCNTSKVFNAHDVENILDFLLLFFIIKYSYSLFFGFAERPGIFHENNFEIMFLLLLIIVAYEFTGYISIAKILQLAIIVFMSKSRSGVLSSMLFFLVVFGSHVKRIKFQEHKFAAYLLGSILVILLVYYIFNIRSDGGLSNIDRYVFGQIFINETKNWNLFDWLVGAHPMTSLSYDSCSELAFYDSLFSYSGSGKCYSVIFHSMIIRTIFDHGFIGLFSSYLIVWMVLKYCAISIKNRILIIFVLLVNGLSVSSLNSIYSAIPLFILFTTRRSERMVK